MPQVFILIAPEAQEELCGKELKKIGHILMDITERTFGIEGEEDVSFTAVNAVCTIEETSVQVEVRYTVGEDEYDRGEPFEPSREQMDTLSKAILQEMRKRLPPRLDTSVWLKPFRGSVFKREEV